MKISEIFICMGIAFAIGAAIGPVIILLMRRLKAKQTERDDGPQSHLKKQGTPTIGGLIFLLPIVAVCVGYGLIRNEYGMFFPAACMLAFGVIGFLDDFLKIKKRSKDGLYPWQKMLSLLLVAGGAACWLYFKTSTSNGFSYLTRCSCCWQRPIPLILPTASTAYAEASAASFSL